MPTLSYPAPVSRGLGGFSEGFLQGLGLLRQFGEAQDRERRRKLEERRQGLEEPYLLARTAALEREARAPEEAGRIMERVFAPPSTLAQPSAAGLPFAAFETPTLAPPVAPSGAAPVPAGQGALSESEFLARAGGEGAARLHAAGLVDPLRRAGQILPDEEVRRRSDHERVLKEVVRPEEERAERLLAEGTPEALEQGYLRLSRAARALAPTIGDPQERSAIQRRAEEYLQKAAALRQDRAEAQRESEDARRWAEVQQKIKTDPDSADSITAVAELVTSAKSKTWRAENMKFMRERLESVVRRQEESQPVRRLLEAVTDGFREHPGNAEKAWDYAFAQNPDAFWAAAGHDMALNKPVPEPVAKRLFGPGAPKDRWQAAHVIALKAGSFDSLAYQRALKSAYTDLGAPDDAPKLRSVLTELRGQQETALGRLLLRLKDVGGTVNEDLVQRQIDAAEANIRGLDATLREMGIPLAPPKAAAPPAKPWTQMGPEEKTAAVNEMVRRLFPGKTWQQLKPAEKQRVQQAIP